jgi:hypothetical protein
MSKRVITKNYLDKKRSGAFSGAPAFMKTAGYKDPKKIREILSGIEAYSVHRPVRKRPRTRPTITFYPHQSYTMDLLLLSNDDAKREKFGYILLVWNYEGGSLAACGMSMRIPQILGGGHVFEISLD